MAQVYKVLKDFDFKGESHRIGEEVVFTTRDGENLSEDGFVVVQERELDPNDEKDAALIAACGKRGEKKDKEAADAEASREEKVADREAVKDDERAAKLGAIKELHVQKYGEDAPEHYDALTEEEMDATKKELEGLEDFKPEEGEEGEDAPEKEDKPSRRTRAR